MIKHSCLLLLLSVSLSCDSKNHLTKNDNTTLQNDNEIVLSSYPEFLKQVALQRSKLKNASSAQISNYLFSIFNNEIPNYWIGTPWDFNGTTRIPKQGSIACGYFVTNTLSDVGFDIQRIKLAQFASSYMIKSLCVNVKTLSGFQQFQDYINEQPSNSIFIVGLDFHTGFILKDDKQSYFLHSNYIDRQGVIKEEIEDSRAYQIIKFSLLAACRKTKH